MDVKTQRRIAAKILKVGVNRVKIDPESLPDVALAITREDVRRHIDDGDIGKRKVKGISRGRAKAVAAKKKKGQRIGPGSRKGPKYSRLSSKERWKNNCCMFLFKISTCSYLSERSGQRNGKE